MILVTGVSGHVGSSLVRLLLEQQEEVRAMVRADQRSIQGLSVQPMTADLCHPDTLTPLLEGIDLVYHCAAHIAVGADAGQCQKVNVEGTRNLIEACKRAGTRRLMYFSSIHAMDPDPVDEILDETRALVGPHGTAPYDCSKAAAETLALEAQNQGLETVVIAPTGVLGPHDFKPSRMGRVLQAMSEHRFPALLDSGFDWVDARDVCKAAIAAAAAAPSGSKYVISGGWASMKELAATVETACGTPPPSWFLPIWSARMGVPFATLWSWLTRTEPSLSNASLNILAHQARQVSQERALQDLGHRPRPLVETVTDSLRWAKQAGMIDIEIKDA